MSTVTVKTEPLDYPVPPGFELFSAQLSTSLYPSNTMNDSPMSPLSLATSPTETPNLKARTVAFNTLDRHRQSEGQTSKLILPSNFSAIESYSDSLDRGLKQDNQPNKLLPNLYTNGKMGESYDFALPLSPMNASSFTKPKQMLPRIEIDAPTIDLQISSASHSQVVSTHHTPKHSRIMSIDPSMFGNISYQISPRMLQSSNDSHMLNSSSMNLSIDHTTSTSSSLLVPSTNDFMLSTPSHSRVPSFGSFMGLPSDIMFMSDNEPFSIISPQHRRVNTNDLLHTPTSSNIHKRIWSLDMSDPFANS
jgi:hypothetical protein